MNTSSPYKDFFRAPSATDKLNLFQLLFESSEINTDLALALLKVVHKELSLEQPLDRSAYRYYSHAIQALRYQQSDMFEQVVETWNAGKPAKIPKWLSYGVVK